MRTAFAGQAGAGVVDERQSRGSGPRKIASSRSVSSTVLTSDPMVSKSVRIAGNPSARGQRPIDGLYPTRPVWQAGRRIEPPPSVPSAAGTKPAATLAAAPPLEPPGVRSVFHGLRVTPNKSLRV